MKTYVLDRITPEPNTGCWLWDMSLDQDGYGRAKFEDIKTPAHRISYMAFRGPVGDFFVLHKCDTPACVNPDHLWLGKAKDNMRDCLLKGRKQTVYDQYRKKILKSHCKKGHELTEENTYLKRDKNNINLVCKMCLKERMNTDRYRQKSKEAFDRRNTQEYKDRKAAERREYNAARKEHLKKVRKEYRLKNLEKIREQERRHGAIKRQRRLNAKPD